MLIITGCARSGTMRIAKSLSESGLPVAFEPEVNGGEDYKIKVSWLAPKFIQPFDRIWHVTRDPILVASSLIRARVFKKDIQNEYTQIALDTIGCRFMESDIPELDYWIDWNTAIEKAGKVIRRFDTSLYGVNDIARAAYTIGCDYNIGYEAREILTDRSFNTGGDECVDIDISNYRRMDELKLLCKRYGYADPTTRRR